MVGKSAFSQKINLCIVILWKIHRLKNSLIYGRVAEWLKRLFAKQVSFCYDMSVQIRSLSIEIKSSIMVKYFIIIDPMV